MYAVIETGGKQYKVSEGDTLFVEKLGVEEGEAVTFDKVLVVADGASNEKTRLSILNAVTILLDVENTKVEVLEGK